MKFLIQLWRIVLFAFFVLWQLILSNIRVAHDVLTSKNYMKPGMVRIPLDIKRDSEIFILANVITLTPGTVTIGVSKNKRYLFVHGMFIDDVEVFKDAIKKDLEQKIRRIFEP